MSGRRGVEGLYWYGVYGVRKLDGWFIMVEFVFMCYSLFGICGLVVRFLGYL